MALVACPRCGANVSSRAKLCPKCGAPIMAEETMSPNTEATITDSNDSRREAVDAVVLEQVQDREIIRQREEEACRQQEEAARRKKEEEERRQREEEARRQQEEAARRKKEEEERRQKEEEARRQQEEAARRKQEEEERRQREEEARRQQEEAARRKQEEEERRQREEEARRQQEEAARRKKEEEERRQKEEEARRQQEEAARRKREEEERRRVELEKQESPTWEKCCNSPSKSLYNNYLRLYPNGPHAEEARNKLSELKKKTLRIVVSIMVGILLIATLVFIFWPTETKSWRKAQKNGSFESYAAYINHYASASDLTCLAHINMAQDQLLNLAGNDASLLQQVILNCKGTRVDTLAFNKIVNLLCDSVSTYVDAFNNEFSYYDIFIANFNRIARMLEQANNDGKTSLAMRRKSTQALASMHEAVVVKYRQDFEGTYCENSEIVSDVIAHLRTLNQFEGFTYEEKEEITDMISSAENKLKLIL